MKGAPSAFGVIVAIGETAVAIGLLFGLLSNVTDVAGAILSLVIWTTAEGFGGPYTAGATDVGAAIIYFILFIALFATRAGMPLGVDSVLTSRLGRWDFLASGPLPKRSGDEVPRKVQA